MAQAAALPPVGVRGGVQVPAGQQGGRRGRGRGRSAAGARAGGPQGARVQHRGRLRGEQRGAAGAAAQPMGAPVAVAGAVGGRLGGVDQAGERGAAGGARVRVLGRRDVLDELRGLRVGVPEDLRQQDLPPLLAPPHAQVRVARAERGGGARLQGPPQRDVVQQSAVPFHRTQGVRGAAEPDAARFARGEGGACAAGGARPPARHGGDQSLEGRPGAQVAPRGPGCAQGVGAVRGPREDSQPANGPGLQLPRGALHRHSRAGGAVHHARLQQRAGGGGAAAQPDAAGSGGGVEAAHGGGAPLLLLLGIQPAVDGHVRAPRHDDDGAAAH
mmetsp:Transcript_47978/g.153744  ORF Transcript_47978/g.153744 Transcript_47978/m.153744 type:complete len:329 (+) Transcript_47978:551-1537(+)